MSRERWVASRMREPHVALSFQLVNLKTHIFYKRLKKNCFPLHPDVSLNLINRSILPGTIMIKLSYGPGFKRNSTVTVRITTFKHSG